MTINRRHEKGAAKNSQAAIDAAATEARERRGRVRKHPEHAARCSIERHDIVGSLYGVHHTVYHERSGLELLERPGLEDPLELEILHVGRRDLRQLTVSLTHEGAGIREPVLGLLVGAQDSLERHLGLRRGVDAEEYKCCNEQE